MENEYQIYQEKIDQSENVLIVYGKNAAFSAVALATSLYLQLKAAGKGVFLACPSEPIVEHCNLVGINKVKKALPKQELVMRIKYDENKLEKVFSDLDEEKGELNIIVKPKKGYEPVAIEAVELGYQSGDYDLVFLIDVQDKEELEQLFAEDWALLDKQEKMIVINSLFGAAPVQAGLTKELGKAANYAGWWTKMLWENEEELEVDLASNLFMGLEQETENFASLECQAESFELAAYLLKQGAVRHKEDESVKENFQAEYHLPKMAKAG